MVVVCGERCTNKHALPKRRASKRRKPRTGDSTLQFGDSTEDVSYDRNYTPHKNADSVTGDEATGFSDVNDARKRLRNSFNNSTIE